MIDQSENLVVCDKQHTLKIHRDIVSLFPVIHSSTNVDHNFGGYASPLMDERDQ
jgi:hypothetical protein